MRYLLLIATLFLSACTSTQGSGQIGRGLSDTEFTNPVISGFAPDPSIVREGEDFYIVNSSFEYFPALPVYHSRNLVDWELVGYGLSNPDWADLADVESSGGIHAATIRYDSGLFYIVTTNIVAGKPESFIVTSKDPAGPWSKPVVVKDAVGIDPSLFFDDDGRVWYTANEVASEPEFPGQALIWIQEIDRSTLQLTGERTYLWSGCCQGVWAEGPHIYKHKETYYLLLSEGGTSFEHAISMASSSSVTGPYSGTPRNPILTHRHLSFDHPITGVGHADIVELEDGRWYGLALGWRLLDGMHGILGRETFLFPVIWETEREWWKEDKKTFPVMSPDTGKIELTEMLPFPGLPQQGNISFYDGFDQDRINLEWNTRRAQAVPVSRSSEEPGWLNLKLQESAISEGTQYSFLGVRQRCFQPEARSLLKFSPQNDREEAGLALIQNDRAALTLTKQAGDDGSALVLGKWHYGERRELARHPISGGPVELRMQSNGLRTAFSFREEGASWITLADDVDITFMSPGVLKGFNYTGLYTGLYASSNGAPAGNTASYDWFSVTCPDNRN